MGLYLCIFADPAMDEEIDGVEVGSYDDFHTLRTTVTERLEGGQWASRFPVLMSHSDSDGEWSPDEATALADELDKVNQELSTFPPQVFPGGTWQETIAEAGGLAPASLADCFIDIDGEPLIGRLRGLAETAANRGCPISFQ